MSTSKVSVFFKINIAIFTRTKINKKNNVYGDPHVIVAKGAHPTSVTDSWIPVDLTNCCNAGEKAFVNIPITDPIPVSAIANLIPPSNAFENLTFIINANNVNTISIIGAAPKLIIGWKILLANSTIVLIKLIPFYINFYLNF